jgi:hypothetical protein
MHMHLINMPSHKLIHASPPQSQNVLWTYLCGTQMESWIRLWMYMSWRWNSGTGSEYTHVSETEFWNSLWTYPNVTETEFWNSLWTYPDVTETDFWNRLWMCPCVTYGILVEVLSIPMWHRWNSGRGCECTLSETEFWNSLWMYPNVTETEFWTRLWMYPCVIDGTVG